MAVQRIRTRPETGMPVNFGVGWVGWYGEERTFFNLACEKSLSRSATLARRTQRNTFLACLQFRREVCKHDNIEAFAVRRPTGTVPAEMPFVAVSFGSVFHSCGQSDKIIPQLPSALKVV